VPACRVKKGKVEDMVAVIPPVEDRLGGQKLVNTGKQWQRNNPRKETGRLQHEKSHE